jgi:hypothetical protein
MNKQEDNEENLELPEDTIKYVYIPDDDVYGTIITENLSYSVVEYYESGVKYRIEIDNDDFILLDEIGIGYINEKDEYL